MKEESVPVPEISPEEPRRINPWSVFMLILIMLGGLVVFYNYNLTLKRQAEDYRPPKHNRIDENFKFTRHDGQEVLTGDLEGKVWLVSHVFTRCPGQCAGITAQMKAFQEKHDPNPLFNLVSVSMDPDYDTPEILTEFKNSHELSGDNWWFVTGPKEALNGYMFKNFRFRPTLIEEDKRKQPTDLFEHTPHVALVDHQRNIRGWYDLFKEGDNAKLEKDLEIVLQEAAEAASGE